VGKKKRDTLGNVEGPAEGRGERQPTSEGSLRLLKDNARSTKEKGTVLGEKMLEKMGSEKERKTK